MSTQTKDTAKNNRRVHEGEMFVVGEFHVSFETILSDYYYEHYEGTTTTKHSGCQVKTIVISLSGGSQATKQESRIFALLCHPFLYVRSFLFRKHTYIASRITHKKGVHFLRPRSSDSGYSNINKGRGTVITWGRNTGVRNRSQSSGIGEAVYSYIHCTLIIRLTLACVACVFHFSFLFIILLR